MLNQLINIVNYPFRRLKGFLKRHLGWLGTPCIILYRGYGNKEEFYLRGRVIEDTGLAKPETDDRLWDNLLAMIKRYGSTGIPEQAVQINVNGKHYKCKADEDGYFELEDTLPQPLPAFDEWQQVQGQLVYPENGDKQLEVAARGEFLAADSNHSFGVITDIDDTILISHSTNVRKKLKLMLFKNAKTRLPFDGASAFYQALYQGPNLEKNHPFFYVSSSEWNLYDLLVDFCQHHDFPKGPFLLRDAQIQINKIWKVGGGNHHHKYEKICRILDMYPHLPFILVGDSGQRDAEIYSEISQQHPDRILAIYIRDVRPSRHQAVKDIAKKLAEKNIDMVLVKDTEEAALHALQRGFLHPEAIQAIVDEKRLNQAMDNEFFQILEKMTE